MPDQRAGDTAPDRAFDREGREYLRVGHGTGLLIVQCEDAGFALRWGGVGEDFIMSLSRDEAAALSVTLGPERDA